MNRWRYSLPYLIVAGFCLGLHNATLIMADVYGFAIWITILLSFVIVSIAGYVGHSVVTFTQRLSWRALFRYSLAMAGNIPTAYALVWLLREFLGLPMLFVAPASSIIMLAINYVLSRWAILRPDKTGVVL
jgi:putative flippase GtrA